MKLQINKSFTKCLKDFDPNTIGRILKTIIGINNDVTSSGQRLHKVGDYFSYSVNDDIRLLTIKKDDIVTLVYVGHHNPTYEWGVRNKPVFDKKSIVGVIPENYCIKADPIEEKDTKTKFDYLEKYGIEKKVIKCLAELSDDELLNAIEYWAPEYQELILDGDKNNLVSDNYTSNVVVVESDEDLKKALLLSLEDWVLFLHPNQRYIRDFPLNKNLIIKGGPGTGKTVTLIHRFIKAFRTTINNKKKPVFISYNENTRLILLDMLKKVGITDKNAVIVLNDFGKDSEGKQLLDFLSGYSHIFIDEAQDMRMYFCSRLFYLLENKMNLPPITMALDLNQSLYSTIGEMIKRLEETLMMDIVYLNYCYRSTGQIINFADNLLIEGKKNIETKKFQEEHAIQMAQDYSTRKITCALSGDKVKIVQAQKFNDCLDYINKYIKENNLSLTNNNWAIILSGDKEKYGKNDFEKFGNKVMFAEDSKGREFFKGIVVFYASNDRIKTFKAYQKQILTQYVAISRFRDKVTYIIISE